MNPDPLRFTAPAVTIGGERVDTAGFDFDLDLAPVIDRSDEVRPLFGRERVELVGTVTATLDAATYARFFATVLAGTFTTPPPPITPEVARWLDDGGPPAPGEDGHEHHVTHRL